uniref:C1q domain-containing protein n=2 Tax=Nothobranchius pienaari TaxID=704102 RepID=A0A1A8L4P5_9TELE
MGALPLLLLSGALFLCGRVEAQSSIDTLKQAALSWVGPLPCNPWDCSCTFTNQRSCCCAANDMFTLEDNTFQRIKTLWSSVDALNSRVKALIGRSKVAFKATMSTSLGVAVSGSPYPCFGPFSTNVPIPFSDVKLNTGNGYNPSMGIFTAQTPGVYVFSFTTYSAVNDADRLYYKVQLMKNGVMGVSVWENNRDDAEDSATQVVVLEMLQGDQVYLELMSGRTLCKRLDYNIFTGYILYPYSDY